MDQRTEEWLKARAGKITASRFKDVLNKLKNGQPGQKRKDYLLEIVTERLTGEPTSGFTNAAMQWGIDHEDEAKAAYEMYSNNWVDEKGFVLHKDYDFIGCSPDGLVNRDGGIEIKCPYNSVNHVKTLQSGMPEEHMAQLQGCMWITNKAFWDFVSYDPRMPEGMQFYRQRIERDQAYIKELKKELLSFNAEVELEVKSLKECCHAA